MEKLCVHCGCPFESKRATGKYCSDNCKQLSYFKRNGFQNADRTLINYGTGNVQLDSKSIQEQIINEIAVKVLKLMDIREAEKGKSKLASLCKAEPFNLKAFVKPIN